MKKITLAALAMITLTAFAGPGRDKYKINIDLNKVSNDLMEIEMIVPQVDRDKIEFQMPKMVPGTYAIYDFGRFLSNVRAYDSLDNELTIREVTENRFEINNARKLYKIKYKAEDTFDSKLPNKIFEPAGTNIEEGKNFVINTFGYFGYLDGMKNKPYELNVTRPSNFVGVSSLRRGATKGNTDQFTADNYFDFHDSPIMYCEPDTIMLPIGNCMVTVSVYSPNKKLKAEEVRPMIASTMEAQRQYLGGNLPVDRYSILIYLFKGASNSGSAGALEHCYSTVLTLPEQDAAAIEQSVKDVVAHEFFHIVTPLNIHSEHIADYDFINPQMSKHLWMYEGCTEYAAQHVQVKYGILTQEQFLAEMRNKITTSGFYLDTLPFTDMSKGALDKYKEQYGNVYQKGALIGMALDIKLRELSGGKYGIQNLMQDLAKKYGIKNFFLDDNLFNEITKLTYPQIGDFLNTYVSGTKKLPYKELFESVGINYQAETNAQKVSLGRLGFGFNQETSRLQINSTLNASDFAKKLRLKEGDEFVSINGVALNAGNLQKTFEDFQKNTKGGDKVKITVARKNKEGIFEDVELKAKAITTETKERNLLEINANATAAQVKLRKDWLESRP